MKRLLATGFIFLSLLSFAEKKETTISRIEEKVVLDGYLNEPFWSSCAVLGEFIQNGPIAGAPASRPTKVRLAYDNSALYIGAEMLDERDSMSLTLSQRDDFGNADFFGLVIDPYNSGTIGFAFLVTSAGVQIDELHQVNDIDNNWNAVWKSEVHIEDDKWVAEIKIPFSAIRFPKKEVQTWGMNFVRNIRRKREQAYWNFFDPTGINLISQLGVVNGVKGVESPVRLSVTPYVSGYIENYEGSTGYTRNGGMDLKYGLNEAFTVDMTLIPDFGQVQFDNQVLNLSPFEVQFNENRQFFTEGTELFNKEGLFYSRRVGGQPLNYWSASDELDSNEAVIENPQTTQLLNATKLSGRTKNGTGIGVFNAVTAKMNAVIEDTITGNQRSFETGANANYNVFVIDQNLKNNSTVTFTNTNVLRSGHDYDANVTALGTDLYTKGQAYNAGGSLAISQLYSNGEVDLGYKTTANFGKSSGRFLWRVAYTESNDSYDQNDLGFQLNNNTRRMSGRVNYNVFKPFWRLYRMWSGLTVNYVRLVAPNKYSDFSIGLNVNGTFRNFMTAGVWTDIGPVRNQDWFEPRVDGRFYEGDQYLGGGAFISSDYSKPFALDMNLASMIFNDENRFRVDWEVSPRFRFNDRFMLVYRYELNYIQNDEGAALTRDFTVPLDGEDPIFAKRDRLNMINRITADYIFTNRMGLTFSLRHYWSKVTYNSFFALNAQGQFASTNYSGLTDEGTSLHNNNFNAFTIDMVYRWVFAPGSELSLVWKNSIFSSSEVVTTGYFDNLEDLVNFPATNSLSLKVLFYIDYWETRQKLRK